VVGRRLLALFVVGLAASGCYVYQPVRPGDALVGSRVRATVSAEQAAELAPVLRNVTPQVTGTLVERSSGSIMLDVPLYGATASGLSTQALNNRVAIPFEDLVTLESRRLSTWRTAATLGAVAVGLTGAWVAVTGNQKVDDKSKTGTDNAVIPIFSLPVAIFR
jgi:hypothetical protein